MNNSNIDHGQTFDWGNTSEDYAKYRDIYPDEFFQKLAALGLCVKGQKVLDLGTGTGVMPRNMYRFGADFTGADISENQIREAVRLSRAQGMRIDYLVCPAEKLDFPDGTFDVVTACQCFMYFDKATLLPNVSRMLKPGGRFAVLFFSWLPYESEIALQSEKLVLQYNPLWTGCGLRRYTPQSPEWAKPLFVTEHALACVLDVPFTRESWNGRIRACRGVGAALPEETVRAFGREHMRLLEHIAPERFTVPHLATILVLRAEKPA